MSQTDEKRLSNKLKRIGKYLLYILISNIIYGLILWYTCTWLAGYSIIYAYLGNIALIVIGVMLDELTPRMYQSKRTIEQIKEEEDKEKTLRIVQSHMDSFVSYKTSLYLFYIFILIISQIIDFDPELVGEDLGNFINATKYSILLLISYDFLLEQFSKDRRRMKKISEKFMKNWAEDKDQ